MEDTYIASKDGKGYIFDIRRPSTIKNSEIYEQDVKASYDNLNTRTGLGNRVIRRVNFIKPEIKPRTVQPGKASTPLKSLETMIKEGLKIKYEEADPWDLDWIKAKENLIKKLKTTQPNITEAEIEIYLIRYPPLNRVQRTRPVTRNPFDESNRPIKDQLTTLDKAIGKVSDEVAKNTTEANKNSLKEIDNIVQLGAWLDKQLMQLYRIMNINNADTVDGRNLLAGKVQQIVQQLTLQQGLSQQILMSALAQLKVDTSKASIDDVSVAEAILSTPMRIKLMALIGNYYGDRITRNPDLKEFEYTNDSGRTMTEKYSINEIIDMVIQPATHSLRLINNETDNTISFVNDITRLILLSPEQINQITQLAMTTTGYIPEIMQIDDATKDISLYSTVNTTSNTALDTTQDEKKDTPTLEDPKTRANNINAIIQVIANSLTLIASTEKEYKTAYENLTKPDVSIRDSSVRLLRINVNYQYEFETKTRKVVDVLDVNDPKLTTYKDEVRLELKNPQQLNNKFLEVVFESNEFKDKIIASYKKAANEKDTKGYRIRKLFDYFYDPSNNPDYVYFITNQALGASMSSGTKWNEMTKFITDEFLRKRIEASKPFEASATKSSENAEIYAQRAEAIARRANEYVDTAGETLENRKEAITQAKIQADLNNSLTVNLQNSLDKIITDDQNPFHAGLALSQNQDAIKYAKLFILGYDSNTNKFLLVYYNDLDVYNDEFGDIGDLANTFTVKFHNWLNPADQINIPLWIFGVNEIAMYNFDENIFISYLNDNLPAKGSGMRKKNKSLIYKNSMKSKKCDGTCPVIKGKGKENPWLSHVKKYRAEHPTLKYSEVLKQAKSTYKK